MFTDFCKCACTSTGRPAVSVQIDYKLITQTAISEICPCTMLFRKLLAIKSLSKIVNAQPRQSQLISLILLLLQLNWALQSLEPLWNLLHHHSQLASPWSPLWSPNCPNYLLLEPLPGMENITLDCKMNRWPDHTSKRIFCGSWCRDEKQSMIRMDTIRPSPQATWTLWGHHLSSKYQLHVVVFLVAMEIGKA